MGCSSSKEAVPSSSASQKKGTPVSPVAQGSQAIAQDNMVRINYRIYSDLYVLDDSTGCFAQPFIAHPTLSAGPFEKFLSMVTVVLLPCYYAASLIHRTTLLKGHVMMTPSNMML